MRHLGGLLKREEHVLFPSGQNVDTMAGAGAAISEHEAVNYMEPEHQNTRMLAL